VLAVCLGATARGRRFNHWVTTYSIPMPSDLTRALACFACRHIRCAQALLARS